MLVLVALALSACTAMVPQRATVTATGIVVELEQPCGGGKR